MGSPRIGTSFRCAARRVSPATLALALVASLAGAPLHRAAFAQAPPVVRGIIVDSTARPIAFAQVRGPGVDPRVSDDSGRFSFTMRKAGPLTVQIKRLGFGPLETKHTVLADTSLTFVMHPVSASLETVRIEAEATVQSLEFHGFYDRLRDRVKGTATGFFIMPEEIEARRGALKATQLMQGTPNVRVLKVLVGGKNNPNSYWIDTIVGPGQCPMTVYVDGVRLNAMHKGMLEPVDFEWVPTTRELAGVEIYTHAHVPPQFQSFALNCGVVLFWTK
jgi:hypothetical protein